MVSTRKALAACTVLLALVAPACNRGDPNAPVRRKAISSAAEALQTLVVGAGVTLNDLSKLPEVNGGAAEACNAKMAEAMKSSKGFTGFGRADAAGKVDCFNAPLQDPVNIADRPYFRRAVEGKGFAVGGYQIGRITKEASIGTGHALVKDGKVTGVIFAPFDLAAVDDKLSPIRVPDGGEMIVIDREGLLVWSSSSDAELGERPSTPLVAAMLKSDKAGGGTYAGVDGTERDYRFRPSAGGALRVAVGIA
jgi:hypothetical protein